MKINFQTKDFVKENSVSNRYKWSDWVHENLSIRGDKTFLLMSGSILGTEKPTEIFITSSIEDIIGYYDSVWMGEKVWIQEFELYDLNDALGYLCELCDVDRKVEKPIMSKN